MNNLHRTYLHKSWHFVETDRETPRGPWLPAEVPGHVHADLVRNGVIGHPFHRMNELGCQWVDLARWSYRTAFEWHPKEGLPRRVLCFEGLDTVCKISLNDETIAEHDNMHVPLEVDVTDKLKDGQNMLRVDFQSAVTVGEARKAAYLEAEGLPASVNPFPERAFVRKAQYMFGWDWGPRLVSCGIWRPVSLVEFASRITDVWAKPEKQEDGSYAVSIQSQTEGVGILHHVLMDADGEEVGRLEGDGVIEVPEPKLWWTHDLGDPHLYSLSSFLERDGEILDAVEDTPVGLRTVELIQKDDEHGTCFRFELNGTPLWVRGANWIPEHSFPSQVTGRAYRDQLERATLMNMNMLRVWGGGLYELDAFYQAADELGILVWQDFAYGCSYVPDTGEWLDVARIEAEANVRRLRNHPSLAHWCGNNENLSCWDYAWGGKEHTPPRFYGENIYDEVIPSVLKELDPTRSYTTSSPWGGEKCNEDRIGDQHNWDAWHGGDWPQYTRSRGRFISEFGFASAPAMSTWRKWIAPEDWAHGSPVVMWHDKTGKGYDTFQSYVGNHYPVPATLEDWTFYSQLNQRDALRHGIEHYRRGEFCDGTLIWQINDCWPVQSWALVDSEGRWKAAAHELRRIYADDLVTISREESTIRVHVVNDGHGYEYEDAPVKLYAVHTLTGDVLKEWSATASLKPGERKQVLEVDAAGLPSSETMLYALWADECDAWKLLAEPKDVKLPKPTILFRFAEDGFAEVRSELPVVDLYLSDPNDETVPENNFVTMPMGGTARLAYVPSAKVTALKARSLAGEHVVKIVNGPF